MLSTLFAHLRRQWMGALALFLVLTGGTAWAVDEWTGANIQDGTLTSADYRNDNIRSVDVRNDTAGGGLTAADLAPGSAGLGEFDRAAFAAPDIAPTAAGGAFEIADNAVQRHEISDETITGADVADNSLGGTEIGAGAVGNGEIVDGGVRAEELGPNIYERMGNQVFPDGGNGQNGDWGTGRSSASCSPSDELISAYAVWHGAEPGEELAISSLNLDIDTETAIAVGASDSSFDHGFEVFAVCLG